MAYRADIEGVRKELDQVKPTNKRLPEWAKAINKATLKHLASKSDYARTYKKVVLDTLELDFVDQVGSHSKVYWLDRHDGGRRGVYVSRRTGLLLAAQLDELYDPPEPAYIDVCCRVLYSDGEPMGVGTYPNFDARHIAVRIDYPASTLERPWG